MNVPEPQPRTPNETTIHVPVLMQEILQWLAPQAGQVFADGTLGGGGHARRLAEAVGTDGRVVAVDADPGAVLRAETSLKGLPILLAQSNFVDLPEVFDEVQIDRVDGILLDLGLSSDQLADKQRGFSFQLDGPLDLRFNPEHGKSAAHLLDRMSVDHLADLIYRYGEERFSRRIARAICERRRTDPIRTSRQLAELVKSVIPAAVRQQNIDPATRTFQALRIAVNQELRSLELALKRLPDRLKPGGKLAIISFHSLEDRMVKSAFRHDPRLEALMRKPIVASDAEVAVNPRSRSAKLRVAARQ